MDVGIDQLFAAGDLGQVQGGIHHAVETAYVGHQDGRGKKPLAHHFQGLHHVRRIAAGGTHHMGGGVVYVVEIEAGVEGGVGRAGEEIQAAVPPPRMASACSTTAATGAKHSTSS